VIVRRAKGIWGLCGGATIAALLALLWLAAGAAADSIAVQPDGKIVVVGQIWPQAGVLARLEADGTIDESFGRDGFLVDRRLPPFQALALGGDGRIAAAAVGGVRLARYLPDGSPDAGFGVGGVGGTEEPDQPIYADFPGGPAALVISPDGSIVVAENRRLPAGDSEAWIKRFDAEGAFAETVGRVGPFAPPSSIYVTDLLPEPDGSVLGTGSIYEAAGPRHSALLSRFLPGSGTDYDHAFGAGEGLVRLDLPLKRWFGTQFQSLARDGDGVVAAGSAEGNFLLARFARDGTLDESFGDEGHVVPPITGPSAKPEGPSNEGARNWAEDVAALGGGRILAAGGTSEWGEWVATKYGYSCNDCPQPLLAMFDASGSLDPSFGDGGVLRLTKPDGSILAAAIEQVVALPDGKILAKGTIPGAASMEPLFFARLNPDGSYDPTFGEGGLTVIRFPCTDQSHAARQRAGCVARLRATAEIGGLQQRRPALSLRASSSVGWAAVSDLTLTLPKYMRLNRGFRSKLRVRGVGDGVKVSVTRPRSGKPHTVIAFSKLSLSRQLRVRFVPGALHLRARLPRRGLTLKLRAHFLDSRWATWAGHDEVTRRAG
jgi:uncharacterized delta-60 repeat protein